MKSTLKSLLVTAAVAAAVGIAPATANATAAWSCSSIGVVYMSFVDGTPVHATPSGGSAVIATISDDYRAVDQSCISNAGLQWWRIGVSSNNGYVYDGYRIG
ncbi:MULTISPECIES: SH3 domain-containing protein [Streptomyces]|uniref:SH3 domain-containing protein n=1 Tax=Streptomyces milbemycinicus TaxID=476552 RepID=A0ABW8M4J3_9ACTN